MSRLSLKAIFSKSENSSATNTLLYREPVRSWFLFTLIHVVVWSLTVLIMGLIAAITLNQKRQQFVVLNQFAGSEWGSDLFAVWIVVPLITTAYALFDLYTRWRQALRPKRVVVGTSIILALWVVQGGFWLPCRAGFWGEDNGDIFYKTCPIDWFPWDHKMEGRIIATDVITVLPFFVIPPLLYNSACLAFGVVALHRQRRPDELKIGQGHELHPIDRQRASSAYTMSNNTLVAEPRVQAHGTGTIQRGNDTV